MVPGWAIWHLVSTVNGERVLSQSARLSGPEDAAPFLWHEDFPFVSGKPQINTPAFC